MTIELLHNKIAHAELVMLQALEAPEKWRELLEEYFNFYYGEKNGIQNKG